MKSINHKARILIACLFTMFMSANTLSAQDIELGTYSRWGFSAKKRLTDDLRKMYPTIIAKGKITYLTTSELTDKNGQTFVIIKFQHTLKKVSTTQYLTATNRNGTLWHTANDCMMSCISPNGGPECILDVVVKCRELNCRSAEPNAGGCGVRAVIRQ